MNDPETVVTAVGELWHSTIDYARAMERLRFALQALEAPSAAIASAYELAPDLEPELTASMAGLLQTSEALMCAATFLEARYEVVSASLIERMGGGS